MALIYGAFRTDSTLSVGQAQFGGVGTSFQISSYSQIDIDLGADQAFVDGDGVTNEVPDDPTQTYLGNAIGWDYNYEVTDGTNTYSIGVFDYDAGGNGQFDAGSEPGFFLGFIGAVPPLNTTLTITGLGDGAFDNPITSLPISSFIPCLTCGTKLAMKDGHQLVENLKVGDLLARRSKVTGETEFAPLLRVFHRRLSGEELTANPKLRPIRIMAGALGNGLPERDLLVSRQHRMLVQSKIAERMFGETEVLIPAIKLTELPGIFVDEDVQEVEYFHLLFDQHEVIYAEGAPTESLYTGPEALKAVSPAAREEILSIFPEIADVDYTPEPARFIPLGKHQKKLVERHLKNERPLLL